LCFPGRDYVSRNHVFSFRFSSAPTESHESRVKWLMPLFFFAASGDAQAAPRTACQGFPRASAPIRTAGNSSFLPDFGARPASAGATCLPPLGRSFFSLPSPPFWCFLPESAFFSHVFCFFFFRRVCREVFLSGFWPAKLLGHGACGSFFFFWPSLRSWVFSRAFPIAGNDRPEIFPKSLFLARGVFCFFPGGFFWKT